ncbi:HEPN/Toprim-associated domain-containing protein, partial [Bacillus velezensis]|uniref:HEPN/Toprim-associated domain-containing protein n=1 Tax=Bacillus velezensis TaxID=492670 RepID=UPI00203AC7C2
MPEDRIIRFRRRCERNQLTYGPPIDELDRDVIDTQYVYSITADSLRRRLGRAGYNRASLEIEFQDYEKSTGKRLHLPGEFAEAHDEAFPGSLYDWLDALAKTVKAGVTPARRAAEGLKP